MTNEEKSKEKYFYIDKERTREVLTGIATSFIGAGLALALFAALHKPPVPPCPMMQFNQPMPCPMKMLPQDRGRLHKNIPWKGHFRGLDEQRRHGEFQDKKFPPRGNFDFRRPEGLNEPPVQKPVPPSNK